MAKQPDHPTQPFHVSKSRFTNNTALASLVGLTTTFPSCFFFSAPRDGGEIEQPEKDSGKQRRERAASAAAAAVAPEIRLGGEGIDVGAPFLINRTADADATPRVERGTEGRGKGDREVNSRRQRRHMPSCHKSKGQVSCVCPFDIPS